MNKYTLTSEDLKNIKYLYSIAEKIKNIYQKLIEAEVNFQTEETQKLLIELKELRKKEEEIEKIIVGDYRKVVAWGEYDLIDEEQEIIKEDFSDSAIFQRILLNLRNFTLKEQWQGILDIPEEQLKQLDYLGIKATDMPTKISLENAIIKTNLEKSIEYDYWNAFLVFLQEAIYDEDYKELRALLINAKYKLSFINKEIEKKLIGCNFVPENKIIFSSNLLLVLANDLEQFKNNAGINISKKEIFKILRLDEQQVSTNFGQAELHIRKCFLKAALIFLNEENITKLKEDFLNLCQKYLKTIYPDSSTSETIIKSCFKYLDDFKQKIVETKGTYDGKFEKAM